MKLPKPPPGLLRHTAQFLMFLVVLACLLIEKPGITWGEIGLRIAIIAGAVYGINRLERTENHE